MAMYKSKTNGLVTETGSGANVNETKMFEWPNWTFDKLCKRVEETLHVICRGELKERFEEMDDGVSCTKQFRYLSDSGARRVRITVRNNTVEIAATGTDSLSTTQVLLQDIWFLLGNALKLEASPRPVTA